MTAPTPTQPHPTVAAPFPPNTLNPPLSQDQKDTIRSFLIAASYLDSDISEYTSHEEKQGKSYDQALIDFYNLVATGGSYNRHPVLNQSILPDLSTPLDFLKNLVSVLTSGTFWLRVGEFLLGAVLLGVGFAEIVKKG